MGLTIKSCYFSDIIPYFASKFSANHFKRIELFITISYNDRTDNKLEPEKKKDQNHILPKHIYVVTVNQLYNSIGETLRKYGPSMLTLLNYQTGPIDIPCSEHLKFLSN